MTSKVSGPAPQQSVLIMIGACLLVIALTIGLLAVDQQNHREQQVRARGVSLVRLLAGFPSIDEKTYESLLRLVSFSQGTSDFAYAALVDPAGRPLAEVSAAGVIVPPAPAPADPSGWVGERRLAIGNSQPIIEFYAPLFNAGELGGQIRLGFYRPGYALLYEQVPVAATLALLIFLLTPLFYFLLRRELRPLMTASAGLEALLRDTGPQQVTIDAAPSMAAFMQRFNFFVDHARQRIHELESDRGQLVASAKLISYKKSRIDMVLQSLPDAVLILDEQGKITFSNERVATLLGVSKEDVLTKSLREWCKPSKLAEFLAQYGTQSAARYATDTLRFRHRHQDSDLTLAINGYPLFSPKENADIQGTLVVIRDVTQSALAEASRAEFVTHLGHELKTPLHTLMLYSEILLDGDQADASSRIQAVNAVHDEVERLVDLVNNLLSITRIEMGSLDLHKQRTRLPDLLEDIRLSLGRAAEQAGIRIDFKLPKDINAIEVDKDLLRIAINNLVSNAIKYNNSGGSVTIEAEETAEAVLIRVRDTGLGITAEERGRIFEKFYRGDRDEIRARGGHGLGLSLTREIIDLHEGEIGVESEPGHGSTFTISLWKRFGLMQKAI